ncbi:MAG: MCE family protein [Opitutaceae bacterium]|nr:MCE family protein [Opitutaceae bacterium]MBP9914200.1 MCE family protein [Opitutaceae bacterium]
MKTKVSPAFVGAFVIGAFALIIIALLSFGGMSLFSKPQRFTVYFDESISGLDLGSSVKLRGVRIGRVVDLNVQFDNAEKKSVVKVICEFNRNMITDAKGGVVDLTSRKVLQELVDQGLRAQLNVSGLATGLLYVELGFFNPLEYPAELTEVDAKHTVVPAVPSAISELQSNLTDILVGVKKVDFAGISKELKGLLIDTHRQVNALDVKELITQWTKAAEAVHAFAAAPELKATLTNVNAAVTDLRSVLTKLDGQIEPNGTKLGETLLEAQKALATFNATAGTLHQFINAQQNLGDGANQAFTQMAEAAAAVQRLADFLERNPQALLTGRSKPE